MTLQISRRGKEYLETAQSLLRAAGTMTDDAIAARLKALAEDYQRRAEKASSADADRVRVRSSVSSEYEWLPWCPGGWSVRPATVFRRSGARHTHERAAELEADTCLGYARPGRHLVGAAS
jgi:hypothetical protein